MPSRPHSTTIAIFLLAFGWFALSFVTVQPAQGADFTVTSDADTGAPGTLRWAIEQANTTPGADIIKFNIGQVGSAQTIEVNSPLPSLLETVTIDGWSQGGTGYNGKPLIQLSGKDTNGGRLRGLVITTPNSSGSIIQGLVLNGFSAPPTDTFEGVIGSAIGILDSNSNIVRGNYIGTNADGSFFLSSSTDGNVFGVVIAGSARDNIIGGATPESRNIISGNNFAGVLLRNSGTISNTVAGNYIGLDALGTSPVPNTIGISITNGATNNTIGGNTEGSRNVISLNSFANIIIGGSTATTNTIAGNYIGLFPNGEGSNIFSNIGILLIAGANNNRIGGTTTSNRNVISHHFGGSGIVIEGEGTNYNSIIGNYIGTNAAGSASTPNNTGILIGNKASHNVIGGTTPGSRNLISGNLGSGITIGGEGTSQNVVSGNYIGTNADGTGAIPNATAGVAIGLGASNNVVGGTVSGSGNLISGNTGVGVALYSKNTANNRVAGNYVGTNAAGTAALPNRYGIIIGSEAQENLVGGTTPESRNLISGNLDAGLTLDGSGTVSNTVAGNYIGTNAAGTASVANKLGIVFTTGASENTLGGLTQGTGNLISGNSEAGVVADSSKDNRLYNNRIGYTATNTPLGNGLISLLVQNDGNLKLGIGNRIHATPGN
jgi:parallel beta-helix repeat protein